MRTLVWLHLEQCGRIKSMIVFNVAHFRFEIIFAEMKHALFKSFSHFLIPVLEIWQKLLFSMNRKKFYSKCHHSPVLCLIWKYLSIVIILSWLFWVSMSLFEKRLISLVRSRIQSGDDDGTRMVLKCHLVDTIC